MMNIRGVTIFGSSENGPFSGTFSFEPGVQIVSGENGYGKSLIATAIAWCLGFEKLSVKRYADPSVFSEGVRTRIELNGQKNIEVRSSTAQLDIIVGSPQRFVRLTRNITGGDPKLITVSESRDGITYSHLSQLLIAGPGAMNDPIAGFQAKFFQWAQWPMINTVRTTGDDSTLYLENIAPLMFIEQLGGWTDIQSQQIRYYGILDVDQYAVEFMLNLKGRYLKRYFQQKFAAHDKELRAELGSILERINALTTESGSTKALTIRGQPTEELIRFYDEFRVQEHLKEEINWDFANEHEILTRMLEDLKEQLNSEGDLDSPDEFKRLSHDVIDERARNHRLRVNLETLSTQLLEESELLKSIVAKKKSTKDLIRLKHKHIGSLDSEVSCPTCNQSVDLTTFDLDVISTDSLRASQAATEKEELAIKNSIQRLEADIRRLSRDLRVSDQEVNSLQHRLSIIGTTVQKDRARVLDLAYRISDTELSRQRNFELKQLAGDLQNALNEWVKKASHISSAAANTDETKEETKRLRTFRSEYVRLVKSLDLSIFKQDPDNADGVYLDEDYLPTLGGRRLKSLASASDQARIILPYILALVNASIPDGNHPGFVVLDEPLQQNPDKDRRKSMIRFLSGLKKNAVGQVIIFTSLEEHEVRLIREGGTPVNTLPAKSRFLQSGR